MFEVVPVQLTAKSTTFSVRFCGKIVANCVKESAAKNIARYFREHGVVTLKKYRALPAEIRIAFISATSMAEPFLPHAKGECCD